MLIVRCPWCGDREETEFGHHGEAHIPRPKDPEQLTDEQWGNYLFFRDNPKGWHRERWTHDFGCRQWFYMLRNTATGEIHSTYAPGDTKPEPPAPPEAQGDIAANDPRHGESGEETPDKQS